MALNDLHFVIPRTISKGAVFFFVIAIGLVVFGFVASVDGPAIAAILPGTIGIALWVTRPREVDGHVAEDGIVLSRPPLLIPFEEIRQIDAAFDPEEPLPPSFRINVHHEWGTLRIPDSPDINSAGIFEALISRFRLSGSRDINAFLHPYVSRHETTFGADRVMTFRTTSNYRKDIHRGRPGLAVTLAMFVTAISWIIIGVAAGGDLEKAFGPLGGTLLFISFFALLLVWVARRPNQTGIKNWQNSSLAITPVGLALIQGDVKGELLWDQLRDIKIKPKPQRYTDYLIYDDPTERLFWYMADKHFRSPRGLLLIVEGAQILVPDFYDRPLPLIYDRIMRYWKPDGIREPIEL